MTKQKNFLFLCKAFKNIIKKDRNTKLLIAGDIRKKRNRKYITNNDLEDNIKLIGYVKIFILILKIQEIYINFFVGRSRFCLVEASICRAAILLMWVQDQLN